MTAPPHILVGEDDVEISRLVSRYLRTNDFHVSVAADGRNMDRLLDDSSEDRGLSQARGPAAELRGRLEQALSSLQALNDPRGVYARMSYDLNLR